MFIIRNIPEQKYFADIKPVTITADSPDLSDSVKELAYSMLKSFAPHMVITIEEGNILVFCNFNANNKLHTFLSEKQYLNIQSVGLWFHVNT